MKRTPVITIDGPSGTGKGSVAKAVADRLGYVLLDSGALYRALGLAVSTHGIPFSNHEQVADIARNINIEFGQNGADSVSLEGKDVTLAIRSEKGGDLASKVGAIPAARQALLARQLAFRRAPGLVADGRDMGTVVFPDAEVKIYLTASAEERAQRRYKQLIGKGIGAILPDLLRDLKERDDRDSLRAISPLKPAEDATILDTTSLDLAQVIERVMALVSAKLPIPNSL